LSKRLVDKNPYLRDPEKKKKVMSRAIATAQRQEGIEISDERAEEVYKVVFEEPPISFFRLTSSIAGKHERFLEALDANEDVSNFRVSRRDLLGLDGAPLAYWVPTEILQLFRALPQLEGAYAEARRGGCTGDDERLVRFHWEVISPSGESQFMWEPFAKGGDFSRFYYDIDLRVAWDPARRTFRDFHGRKGRETARPEALDYYFRGGLTWPRRTQRGFNSRILPQGCVFADKGPAIFPRDSSDTFFLLGVLNSSIAEYLCRGLMSFGSYEVGVVQKLPIPRPGKELKERIATSARHLFDAKRSWDEGNEVSTTFRKPWVVEPSRGQTAGSLAAALDAILAREVELDVENKTRYSTLNTSVFLAYDLSIDAQEVILTDLGPRPPELIWPQMEGKSNDQKRMDHVARLLSFCVKRILEKEESIVPLVPCNNEPSLADRVITELSTLFGEERVHQLEGEIASELRKRVPGYRRAESIGEYLANGYFEHHVRLYKSRPIFWHLASTQEPGHTPAFSVLVHYHRFHKDSLRKLRGTYVRSFLERRERELAQARKDNRADDVLEFQRQIEETREFDKKLQALEEGKFPIRVPWKDAGKQPKGWDPDIDDGVKVNILPLQTAGLLRIAKVVSTKADEADE